MELAVNGEKRELPDGCTVAGLLEVLKIPAGRVAVEVNATVVKRADHGQHALQAGDSVEVVAFVGGG
jgi:sulfur carrier protein